METTSQTENQNHNDGDGETSVNQSSNIEREEVGMEGTEKKSKSRVPSVIIETGQHGRNSRKQMWSGCPDNNRGKKGEEWATFSRARRNCPDDNRGRRKKKSGPPSAERGAAVSTTIVAEERIGVGHLQQSEEQVNRRQSWQ